MAKAHMHESPFFPKVRILVHISPLYIYIYSHSIEQLMHNASCLSKYKETGVSAEIFHSPCAYAPACYNGKGIAAYQYKVTD